MSKKTMIFSGCYHRVCRNLMNYVRGGSISVITLVMAVALAGCSKSDGGHIEPPIPPSNLGKGLFVLNEGNFMAGNASITYYNMKTNEVKQNFFSSANGGAPLGDAATQMIIYKGLGYITLSNSGKIYIIDPDTGVLKGKITGLNSPRYILFLSETKAYVTNINSNQIDIINPSMQTITGSIALGEAADCGEQMVMVGGYVYTNCWSYNNKILKIDPNTNRVIAQYATDIQPASICVDKENMLWIYTDGGGWEENPVGYEDAKLTRIDPATWTVKSKFEFGKGAFSGGKLITDKTGSSIFFLVNNNLYNMPIGATTLPTPVISDAAKFFYSFTVDKEMGDVYMADAADYQSAGMVYRYDATGKLKNSFQTDIIPGSFCFN